MERLEAAMVKARAARQEALERARAAKGGAKGVEGEGPEVADQNGDQRADLAALPPVILSPDLARRQRLGALLGQGPATPHDILRSRVVRQMGEKGWKRLAVTSPTTKCGKSTLALNLALSLARYGQFRILLLDLDLRHPSLASLLELRDPPEITGLLRGGKLARHGYSYGPNLALVPNGLARIDSAELLQDATTLAALDRLEAEWRPDIVICDLPPMQGNDDTLGFLPHVDCALIVAAAEMTTLPQLDRCESEVGQLTNVLGVVLNKCRYTDRNTGFDQSYY
ncbi:P-loop NTPase [Rhodobacter sp. KR11]|uniref:nucleotide-binding protein n=1 Tax=Rhodobacter sp. KR11 TaxID=2974588 RepID=UPI002222AB1E|nr:P-loop NTPase [Rhodobacter sp. KR11]MCW1920772.1 P-loop NTPase [Rhodobacter sp. KR11]